MKIRTISQNNRFSFGAVKIKSLRKENEKSQTRILRENANKTIEDTSANDSFERISKRFNDCTKKMETKKNQASNAFFATKAMREATIEERDEKAAIYREKEAGLKNLDEHLTKVTETVDKLKTDLAELNTNLQTKSMRESEAIQKLKAKYMTNEGFSKIAGYEDEKNILYKYFISEIEKAERGEEANVPNAVLFFGPKGNGKTTFSKAFAQEIGANHIQTKIATRDQSELCPKFYERLIKKANEAKELYEETGKPSVIFIDEIGKVAGENSTIIPELKDFIKDCYEKYHCIVFAATNHPLKLQLPIAGEDSLFPYVVSVDPPNAENKQAILKYYLNDRLTNASDEDYKMLADMLKAQEEKTGGLYSNSFIKDKICLAGDKNNVNTSINDVNQNIQTKEPDINSEAVEKYNNEMDLIMADRVEE